GTPTGTVTFMDGSTTLGTSPVNGSGQATYSTSTLLGGTHSLTASYSGDSNFASSTSPAYTQTVNPGNSSTSLSSSAPTSNYLNPVPSTATVTPVAPAFTTPTGTVTFKDGSTTLGTGTLNSSGQATYTTSSLAIGSHSISAVYNGDSNLNGSPSNTITQT